MESVIPFSESPVTSQTRSRPTATSGINENVCDRYESLSRTLNYFLRAYSTDILKDVEFLSVLLWCTSLICIDLADNFPERVEVFLQESLSALVGPIQADT
jgi:hypothetical protein